jgi:tRNA threonylcarbamoyladenosine modification (KEOPS) complex Cgi121 subunit
MLIEELTQGKERLFVGIAEFENARNSTRDELVRNAAERPRGVLALQMMDASCVSGPLHLLAAVQNAVSAWKGGYSIARDLDVEIVVYASAQRQIAKAFERMGLRDGLEYVAFIVIARTRNSARNCVKRVSTLVGPERIPPFPPYAERLEKVKAMFSVSDAEIETIKVSDELDDLQSALSRCVVGRISLVAVGD